MKSPYRYSFPMAVLAALTVSSAGAAEEPTLESLIHPQSEFEGGIGWVAGETNWFGMYNGLTDEDLYPILSGSINRRNDNSGTWVRAFATNYGYEGGQARIEHEKQGDWSYFFEGGRT